MDKGKEKCEILKAIRAYVAEKYGLEYTATECTHKVGCSKSRKNPARFLTK